MNPVHTTPSDFMNIHFDVIPYLIIELPPSKTLYTFIFSHMHATCPAPLIPPDVISISWRLQVV
jgi:hypothetical protein